VRYRPSLTELFIITGDRQGFHVLRGRASTLSAAGAAVYNGCRLLFRQTTRAGATGMRQTVNVNPTCEHGLYLRLFVTNAGGW
jgi:hypothetical protein